MATVRPAPFKASQHRAARQYRAKAMLGAAVVATLGTAHLALGAGATHTLTTTGAGTWTGSTWTGGAPDSTSAGDTAIYTPATNVAAVTTLDTNAAVIGQIRIGGGFSDVKTWTINAGSGTFITMDNTGGGTNAVGTTTSLVATGTGASWLSVNVGLVMQNTDMTVAILQNAGITVSGAITATSNRTLTFLNNSNSSTGAFIISGDVGNGGAGDIVIETAHVIQNGRSFPLTMSGILGSRVTAINHVSDTDMVQSYATTASDRINDSAILTLGRTALYQQTNNATSGTTETVGGLVMGQGHATIQFSGGPNNVNNSLNFTSGLTRNDNATALIRGVNLGLTATATTSANRLFMGGASGTGLTLAGTTTTSTGLATGTVKNLAIVPYLLGAHNISTGVSGGPLGANFLTYDTVSGLRLLGTNEQSLVSSAATNDNVKSAAGANTVSGSQTWNSLMMGVVSATAVNGSAATVTGDGGVLSLTSGALGNVGHTGGAGLINGFSSIVFGGTAPNGVSTNEAVIQVGNAALTVGSAINTASAGGGLTKGGAGTLVLSASNLYTGATIVNQGTLMLGDGTTGNIDASSGVTVNQGAFLSLNLPDGGAVTNAITGTGTVTKLVGATANTISGNIGGGVLVRSEIANGTLVLSGVNTYSGGTTATSVGTLRYVANGGNTSGGVSSAMSSNSALTLGAAALAGSVLQLRSDDDVTFSPKSWAIAGLVTASQLTIDVGAATSASNKTITLTGTPTFSTTNAPGADANGTTINVTSSSTGYTLALGSISSGRGHTSFNATTASLAIESVNASDTLSYSFVGSGAATINDLHRSTGSRSLTINQSGLAGSLTLTGVATQTVGTNQAGYFYNLTAGRLNLNNSALFNVVTTGTGRRVLTVSGGTLDNTSVADISMLMMPQVNIEGDFTFGGTRSLALGTTTTGSAGLGISAGATRTITTTANTLALGALADGVTAHQLVKTGPGNLVVNGIAYHTGGTAVNQGTLVVNGGTINSSTFNTTTTTGNTSLSVTMNTGNTLSLRVGQNLSGPNFAAGTFITSITNSTTFLVSQFATAAATAQPTTFVAGSATGLGSVDVSGTGKLGGTGIIRPSGAAGLNFTGTSRLAPGQIAGNTIGTLNVNLSTTTGGITMGSGSGFEMELGSAAGTSVAAPGASDRVALVSATAGDVTFNNNVIDLLNSASAEGGAYKLFDSDLVSGTAWNGLTLTGQDITGGLAVANIGAGFTSATLILGDGTYGDYDDIYVVVPEPTMMAPLMLAGLIGLRRRRRQR